MRAIAAGLAVILAGSAGSAAAAEPAFRPELFFAGRTHSRGAFVDRDGTPESRFTGDTKGRHLRDGSTAFDQVIRFDDGTTRSRRWRIARTGDLVEATATDVVGTARGRIEGRTLRLDYTVITDPANRLLDVDFEQHLTLERGGRSMANRSLIRKFGFLVKDARERFVRR